MLILIMVISVVVVILLLTGCLIMYLRHRTIEKRKADYSKGISYVHDHQRKTIIQRLMKFFQREKHSQQNRNEPISNDQSLTALLDEFSTSTVGPGN